MIEQEKLYTQFKTLINQLSNNEARSIKLIVGISGGADSVFLLHHLAEYNKRENCLKLIAAHLQHSWRGRADEADAAFCQALAKKLDVDFVTMTEQEIPFTKKWNGSLEELGRHQRRAFLFHVMSEHQAHGIALGHNAQDQEETFFIRLLRGASLDGLGGMHLIKNQIIRPLLHTNRDDIEAWLKQAGQLWCHDSDNENRRFLRNKIRHELLPLLRNIDPRFTTTFAHTQEKLRLEQELINLLIDEKFTAIFNSENEGNLSLFKTLPQLLQGHLLKKFFISNKLSFPMSGAFLQESLRFLNSNRGGTHALTTTWGLYKKASTFLLKKYS